MISVDQAFDLIQSQTPRSQPTSVPVSDALGLVLWEPVTAPFHLPSFRQSAMDGYALQLSSNHYVVSGTSKAGDSRQIRLTEGHACRIFTGALVPENADTVVVQEHVHPSNGQICVLKLPEKGANIRAIGEQTRKGHTLLPANHRLTPASIGLLAAFGIEEVSVYKKPSVGILVTGNELITPGEPLADGKIYDSNSIMLRSALIQQGIEDITIHRVPDELHTIAATLVKMIDSFDILVLSGGISVGDYDFVREALTLNKVDEIFYKVKQKPGKPLWFGQKDRSIVFGLPGNPASALTCYYLYVGPAIAQMMGQPYSGERWHTASITTPIHSPGDRALFLKALHHQGSIQILGQQNSSMLLSYTQANALAYVPEKISALKKGDPIQFITLPSLN